VGNFKPVIKFYNLNIITMKTILLFITMFALLAFPKANFGQVAPTLGAASSYALFTGTGASFSNIGAATIITGDIGSNASPITGFLSAQVVGATNAQNATSAAVAANVGTAFSDLNQGGSVLGVTIVNGQVIKKGVWSTGAAATLSGTVTLDGEGDPNAIFIIRIGGALATDPASNVILINSASLCNVYWQVNGAVSLGNSSIFRGTIIATGAISLLEASSLFGRGLSTAGAIDLHNNAVTNSDCSSLPAAVAGPNISINLNSSTQIGAANVAGSTFSWSSVPAGFTSTLSNPTVTPLVTTTYTVVETITATGITNSHSVVVTLNSLPAAVAGSDRTITQNTSTQIGAADVPGSTFSWSSVPGEFTSTVSNPTVSPLVTTTYTVVETITDTGATNTHSVVVTVNPLPAAVAGADRAICVNASTQIGAATVPGSTYSWSSIPAGFTSTVSNPTVSPLVTTTYTVVETITATGTTNSHNVIVTVNPIPTAIAGADRAICLNSNTQIGAAAIPGNTYSWTSTPAGFTSTTSNPTVTPLVTTTYTLVETITATGCQKSNSVIVTVDLLPPTASVISAGGPTTICADGSVTLSGNIGGTWSTGAVTPSILVNTAGDYFVTNTSGCGVDVTSNHIIVTVNPLPAAVAGADRAICLNVSTTLGAAAVVGSTYSWSSSPAGFSSTLANPTAAPVVTTTYTVVETTTATGCTNTHSVIVTVYPLPAAIAGSNRDICINTTTQIGGANVAGTTYSWTSVPIGFTSTIANPTVTPLVNTTYTVIQTNTATGCINSNSVVVTVNPVPAAIAGAERIICLNTATQIGGSTVPGSIYEWTSVPVGFTSAEANPTVTPMVTTTYRVLETTAAGCSNANSVVVTVNPIPAAISGADRVICANTSTTLGAAAITGSTYSWSSVPAGFTSTVANPTVNPLVTTTYTVVETITATGCTNTNSVVVTVNPSPAAVAGFSRTICTGTSTTLGAAAVTESIYRWSSVPTGFNSNIANPTVSPLVTTTYIVAETNTATGCVNSNSVLVTVTSLPEAKAGADRAICLNASTQIGAVAIPGNTYSWTSVPAGFTSTEANPTITPLVTTTYTVVEIKTNSECVGNATNSVVVTVNPRPAAIAGADRAICMNASTQIGAAANAGNTYSWTSVPAGFASTSANPTVNPLVTTTYTVVETITAIGCTNNNSVVVTVNPIPTAVAGAARTICQGVNTQIGAAAVAGNTYSWSSVPTGFTSSVANPTVNPQVTTTYTVVETTAAGCTKSNSVIVTVNPAPAASAGADRTICENTSTQIGAVAVAGSTYSWSSVPAGFTSSVANPTISPLVTKTYTVVETNMDNGCQTSNSVTVAISTATVIVAQPAGQLACIGNPASFSVSATGTDLTYQWRKGSVNLTDGGNISGATTATLNINPVKATDAASNYNVVITGACSSNETSNNVSLEVNAAPSISTVACVGSAVSFSAAATGDGLTYQWRKGNVDLTDGGNISGSNSPTLTINPVTLTDASSDYNVLINGACSPNATSLHVALLVNPALNIIAEPIDQTACAGEVARFSVTAEGAGLTYQWRKGEVNLINGGNISGATSSTLMINPVKTSDVASNYNVVITGACSPMSKSKDVALVLCIPVGNANLDAGDTTNAVTIYPNPFTSSIDIKVNDASKMINYELKIFNILGEEVMNTLITKDITTLKTSNLPSGIYMYEVNSNNQTIQSGKLISKQ